MDGPRPVPAVITKPEVGDLLRKGEEGEVVVSIEVDEQGNVVSPKIISASDERYAQRTLKAVSNWKFNPIMKNGKAVRRRVEFPLKFTTATKESWSFKIADPNRKSGDWVIRQ